MPTVRFSCPSIKVVSPGFNSDCLCLSLSCRAHEAAGKDQSGDDECFCSFHALAPSVVRPTACSDSSPCCKARSGVVGICLLCCEEAIAHGPSASGPWLVLEIAAFFHDLMNAFALGYPPEDYLFVGLDFFSAEQNLVGNFAGDNKDAIDVTKGPHRPV